MRKFIVLDSLKQKNEQRLIPNELFEENWKNLKTEKNNGNKPDLLLNVPKHFAYFMDHGIILNTINNNYITNYKGRF